MLELEGEDCRKSHALVQSLVEVLKEQSNLWAEETEARAPAGCFSAFNESFLSLKIG